MSFRDLALRDLGERRDARPAPSFRRTGFILAAVLVGLTAGIALAGLFYLRAESAQLAAAMRSELSAISELRVRQIDTWRRERLGDARVLGETPIVGVALVRFVKDPSDSGLRQRLLASMNVVVESFGYSSVQLLDANGEALLAVGRESGPPCAEARRAAAQAVREMQPVLTDLQAGSGGAPVHMDLLAPVFSEQRRPVGSILLRVDPNRHLYPLLQAWPAPSRSGESLLVRLEGAEAVVLNQPRLSAERPLALRVPLSALTPAALAASGRGGVIEAVDYRGVPVVAMLKRVAGFDWCLVTKMDREEAYGPIRQRMSLMVAVTGLLLLSAALSIGMIWRHLRVGHFRALYQLQIQQQALSRQYEYLVRHANDIILLTDKAGHLLSANDAACRAYGREAGELVKMSFEDLCAPEVLEECIRRCKHLDSSTGALFETTQVKADGSTFPVEVSARLIEIDGARFHLCVIRDITERKQAEAALRERDEEISQILETTAEGIWRYDPHGRITYVNPKLAELLGYSTAEILGASLFTFVDEANHAELRETLARRSNGIREQFDFCYRRRDGTELWAIVNGSPVYDRAGRYAGAVSMITDMTKHRAAEEEIALANRKLRILSRRLLRAEDQERRRIARELHDSTAQHLAALAMHLGSLQTAGGEPARAGQLLSDSRALLDQCSRDIRDLSRALYPPLLDELGLAAVLRPYVEGYTRRTGISVGLDISPDMGRMDVGVELALFRIAQEALTNVYRHSGSSSVSVVVEASSEEASLEVTDRGHGFGASAEASSSVGAAGAGVGLWSMRERASELGGRAEILTSENGTTVRVRIPLGKAEQADAKDEDTYRG